MQLFVMLHDQNKLSDLLNSPIQGIIVPIEKLSHRVSTTVPLSEVESVVKTIKAAQKHVWLSMNAILHPEDLTVLRDAFNVINDVLFDGLLFADLAVAHLAEEYNLKQRLIYQPETYATTVEDLQFWHQENVMSVCLARELTLASMHTLAKNKPLPITLVGHGFINMFHSRRPLIENYFKYTNDENPETMKTSKQLTLIEEIRDEKYPIIQDDFGTHIFRPKPLQSFSDFESIHAIVDYFIIESFLIEHQTLMQTIADYHDALKHKKASQSILGRYQSTHDTGYYHKTTSTLQNKEGIE